MYFTRILRWCARGAFSPIRRSDARGIDTASREL
jgi:hypothetical protein